MALRVDKTKKGRGRGQGFWESHPAKSTVDEIANRIAFSADSPRKDVVLFVKGSFRAKKGYASAPRKVLFVKAIASRTVVCWTSFRTSKCHGGSGEDMGDVRGRKRVRQCTTVTAGVESPCPFLNLADGVAFTCDMDTSATVFDFCVAGYAGLVHKTWPQYLLQESYQY